MAEASELTPNEYISHHLTNMTSSMGQGDFWVLHVDTLVMSVLLGIVSLGFLWWAVRGATAGIPGKRQAFVELAVEFVDDQGMELLAQMNHAGAELVGSGPMISALIEEIEGNELFQTSEE